MLGQIIAKTCASFPFIYKCTFDKYQGIQWTSQYSVVFSIVPIQILHNRDPELFPRLE